MMRLFAILALVLVAACGTSNPPQAMNVHYIPHEDPNNALITAAAASGYWRPISAPNVLLAQNEAQGKLEFDLSQCRCGVYPRNIPTATMMKFQPDRQRIVETSKGGACANGGNNAVIAECMRARGWEPTLCSGRLPIESGAFCPL